MKQFKANLIKEQAEATNKELIANLTEAHTKQMEILIKLTTVAMKEMMSLMKTAVNNPANAKNKEKKHTRKEKQRRYKNAPVCKHCNKKHPSKPKNKCWELEINASSCPSYWKSSKST
jgi:hypothetical protein